MSNIVPSLPDILTFARLFSCVDDVLTSVQKTEESLRRLKKIRDRSAATSSNEARGVGDDEKIREQLLLDVYSYCEMVGVWLGSLTRQKLAFIKIVASCETVEIYMGLVHTHTLTIWIS